MTRIAYFDAFSGISGDMTVGALIDAGASADAVIESLNALNTGARFEVEKTIRGGVAASTFRVSIPDAEQHHRQSLRSGSRVFRKQWLGPMAPGGS